MGFKKDFDELLEAILTDYRNQFPQTDTSQGSLIFIKSACLASALWGLYKYQDYIADQIFPDTADTAQLEHHAWVRGLTRKAGETDAELLARLLEYIRRPPAGGNKYDYEKWALEVEGVRAAYCYPLAQGLGTVDVLIMANDETTGSEVPSSHSLQGTITDIQASKLIDGIADFTAPNDGGPVRPGDVAVNSVTGDQAVVTEVEDAHTLALSADIFPSVGQGYSLKSLAVQVKEFIDRPDIRPVTASVVRIVVPTLITQDVAMTVAGQVNKTAIAQDIMAYMHYLEPGQPLYTSRLAALAIQAGAENAVVSTPDGDVVPGTSYEIIRPGDIIVS